MVNAADLLSYAIGVVIAAIAFILRRVEKTVDEHSTAIEDLKKADTAVKEDILRNYIRSEQIEDVKQDIIGRVDRLETSFTKHAETQEHRTQRLLEEIRDALARRG